MILLLDWINLFSNALSIVRKLPSIMDIFDKVMLWLPELEYSCYCTCSFIQVCTVFKQLFQSAE